MSDAAAPVKHIDPLWVDIYAGDLNGRPNLATLVDAGMPWSGVILKATQGDYYSGGGWFRTYWPLARQLAINASRYALPAGATNPFRRGCYHYFDCRVDAKLQADYFLRYVEFAGGWRQGDLAAMVDVETAGNTGDISASQIVDGLNMWSQLITQELGVKPILYGGSFLADHGITDHCGCQALIIARYTPTLPSFTYTRIGWTSLLAWQYAGVPGGAFLEGYPKVCPMGATDIMVLTAAMGGQAALDYVAENLLVYPTT